MQIAGSPARIPLGYWFISADVWEALSAAGALDNEPHAIPTLWGRPLMVDAAGSAEQMQYLTGQPGGQA